MPTEQTLSIRRLRTGSVFRIVAAGCFFTLVPFCIVMGVLALFGVDALKWNNEPVLGWKGFVAAPFMGLFMAAVFTAFGGVGLGFGLWLYSKFRPLTLRVLLDDPASSAT
jgi:hypothetical protein